MSSIDSCVNRSCSNNQSSSLVVICVDFLLKHKNNLSPILNKILDYFFFNMDTGVDRHTPAGGDSQDEDNNIVNEQPIEISSDSSDGGEEAESDESESDLDTDSDVSVINSVSDSNESHNDKRLEHEFETLLMMPSKGYKQYMRLWHIAVKLDEFGKMVEAIDELEKFGAIPSHIWLKYLTTRQTANEDPYITNYYTKALSSYYDVELAEFIVKSLEEKPLVEHQEMWINLLADYGIERVDFIAKFRSLLSGISDNDQAAEIEKTLSAQCVTWNCNEDQSLEFGQIIEEFKQKLKTSGGNSSWLQEMFILRIDTLTIDKNIKIALIKLIFERSLAKYPMDSGLWLDYIAYMQKPIEPNSVEENYTQINDGYLKSKPLELIERALMSQPSVKLNHNYLQLMEQNQYSLEKIDEKLNRHFDRIERYMEQTVELQLDYLAYRVRNTNCQDEEQANALRVAFRHVWDRLSDQYGEMADTGYEVLQLYALVEYAQLKSPSNGAAIWSEIFSYPGNSKKSYLWLAYAQMESEHNGGHKIRTVLQQALMALPAEVEGITDLYRRYERCFGTSATIADCQAYCKQMQERTFIPSRRRSTTFALGRRQQTPFQSNADRKHLPPAKKSIIRESLPPKKPLPSAKKNTQKKPTADEPKAPSFFKYATHLEANKIFIKNLYAKCSKEDLTEAFQEFGTIKDVRLVFKQNQWFKGFAYIEYELPEEAQKAVEGGDGLEIGGQKIVVAISNPPVRGAGGFATTAAGESTGTAALGDGRKAEKRRFPTTLIPTKLVMQEVKRRKKLELDEADAMATDTSLDANGKSSDANGKQALNDNENESTAKSVNESAPAAAPKSNDDFRKLFNI